MPRSDEPIINPIPNDDHAALVRITLNTKTFQSSANRFLGKLARKILAAERQSQKNVPTRISEGYRKGSLEGYNQSPEAEIGMIQIKSCVIQS